METWLLLASGVCLLVGFAHTLLKPAGGRIRPGGLSMPTIAAAFLCLGAFLFFRGRHVGACPLNTLPDVLIFLGWAVLLIYLVIGPVYRLSLLGAFTAPLVVLLQLAAILFPSPDVPRAGVPNAWVELHAALSVIAYGAFALAAVSSVMFLLQDRFLKTHSVSPLVFRLPPVNDLDLVNVRLAAFGFFLLSIAFAAGLLSGLPVEGIKFWASAGIWLIYGVALLLKKCHRIPPRKFAWILIAVFLIALVTLPGIHFLSTPAR